jgi:hypothetical protein
LEIIMRPLVILLFISSLMLAGCGSEDVTSSAVKSGPVIAGNINAVP